MNACSPTGFIPLLSFRRSSCSFFPTFPFRFGRVPVWKPSRTNEVVASARASTPHRAHQTKRGPRCPMGPGTSFFSLSRLSTRSTFLRFVISLLRSLLLPDPQPRLPVFARSLFSEATCALDRVGDSVRSFGIFFFYFFF